MIVEDFVGLHKRTHELAGQINASFLSISGAPTLDEQQVIGSLVEKWFNQLLETEDFHHEFKEQYESSRSADSRVIGVLKDESFSFNDLSSMITRTLPFISDADVKTRMRNVLSRLCSTGRVSRSSVRTQIRAVRSALNENRSRLKGAANEIAELERHAANLLTSPTSEIVRFRDVALPVAKSLMPDIESLREDALKDVSKVNTYRAKVLILAKELKAYEVLNALRIASAEKEIDFLKSATGVVSWMKGFDPLSESPFYRVAPTVNSFGAEQGRRLNYGLFTPEQEGARVAGFDRNRVFSLSAPLKGLLSQYFEHDEHIPEFSDFVGEIDFLARSLPKLPASIDCIAVIPAYKEGKNLDKTLANIAKADVPGKLAIVLLDNLSGKISRDLTVNVVNDFRKSEPNLPIYHIFKRFREKVPIGFVRRYGTDLALKLRDVSGVDRNFIIVSMDADIEDLERSYFKKLLELFDDNDYLDAVELKLNFPEKCLERVPVLRYMQDLFDYCWEYMRANVNPVKAVRTYGAASAVKASSYVLIKGYNPNSSLCEDLQIGWLLDRARRGSAKGRTYFEKIQSKITVNPRRAVESYLQDISYFKMYESFDKRENFSGIDWEALLDMAQKKRFIPLEDELKRFVYWWAGKVNSGHLTRAQFEDMFKGAMKSAGLPNYQLVGWEVKLQPK